MNIATKFSIGDTVYAPTCEWDQSEVTCPDCLGTTSWEAKTPAGEVLAIRCPTCTSGYDHLGYIIEWANQGRIQQLTIGSIQVDTNRGGTRYMCKETGVGSGTSWSEQKLCASREEAEEALPAIIQKASEERRDAEAKRYAHSKNDAPGSRAAFYRKKIRDSKKELQSAEEGLDREKGVPA